MRTQRLLLLSLQMLMFLGCNGAIEENNSPPLDSAVLHGADVGSGEDTAAPPPPPPDDASGSDVIDAIDLEGDIELNPCGGTRVLSPEPGTPCGACLLDEFVCDGIDNTVCNGDTPCPELDDQRLLYSAADIAIYQARMSGAGPFYARGDASHGGQYSPGDGERAEALAADFLADPSASFYSQSDLPYSSGDPYPTGMTFARPMHAAWVAMTQPEHPQRDTLQSEVKDLLLSLAADANNDFSNSTNYPVNYPGFVPSPIFGHSQWLTRMIKARDMLGRDAFDDAENEVFDGWLYDYANWIAHWMHHEMYVKRVPNRLNRDYGSNSWPETASSLSYDGGPLIGSAGKAYTNRHAAVASTMSLAANYVKHFGYQAPASAGPAYGRYTVDELIDHSRLFVEETIRFSIWPQGIQGDFERGDQNNHGNASPQQGWLYSVNVLANLMEMAEYHAKRGDMSVWNYGTTEGHDGSAGAPIAGGFAQKNLHFYAWFMSRYVNDGWGRTNRGEPLVLPHFYHDVIPAATAARFAPNDALLEAAWKRSGDGFPDYPQSPQSQGPYQAQYGEGAKMIGVIEHGDMPRIGN
ncbi:MAG: hypothetical protein ACNA8W_14115 [Bradymonadaceae bacterium]